MDKEYEELIVRSFFKKNSG